MSNSGSNAISKDVQDAFYRVVHDRDVAKLAAQMGMTPGVLYNKANFTESTHHKPTLADAIVLTNITGDKRVAQAFCRAVDMVAVPLPDLSDVSTDALLTHLTEIQIKNGNFHEAISDALANDNEIDAGEFTRIEIEAHQYIACILEGLARMREMSGG